MTSAPSVNTAPASANVAAALVDVAAAFPDRPALVGADGRSRWTLGELTDRAARIASGLVRRGLPPGGRVVLLVRDQEEALVMAVATLWAGGTLVVPPASSGWRAALQAANLARPTAVVADPAGWFGISAVPGLIGVPIRVVTGRRHWPALATIADLAVDGPGAMVEPRSRSADAPALVSWTTGTTGRPHAVVRTHGVLAAQHAAIRQLRAPHPGDVDLVGLPTMALHDLACGVPIVLPPRAHRDRDGVLLRAVVTRAAVTTAAGFPVLFERLIDGAGPASLPGLRCIHVGGAPVRPDLLDRLAIVAPNATIVVVYGATEAEPITAIDAAELRASGAASTPGGRGLLVGRPCSGIDVRLVALGEGSGRSSTSRAGHGRILVRGTRVAHDAVRSDADGWLDTGDVGALDGDGRLWLLGRASNALGEGLLPAEVEEPVTQLEDVGAAALVAVSDRDRPRLVLAVELAANATAATVQARVASMASDHGWGLDRVAVVHRLPRDARSGKVDYRRLRALIG